MDTKALVDMAAPYVTALVKKELPDADEKVIGQTLVAIGTLFTDVGNGLIPAGE